MATFVDFNDKRVNVDNIVYFKRASDQDKVTLLAMLVNGEIASLDFEDHRAADKFLRGIEGDCAA